MTRRLVTTTIALAFSLQAAAADKGARYIHETLAGKEPKVAIVEARQILKELRASDIDRDGGVLEFAEAATGMIASAAGEHQEAVDLLLRVLPEIAKRRNGDLLMDEYRYSLSLVDSLEDLERSKEAMDQLGTLLGRARKGVIIREQLESPAPNERGNLTVIDVVAKVDWVIEILERLGNLQLQGEEWAKAEKTLREAEALLAKEFPGEQQARFVKIREKGDIAARKQGKKIRPRVVGRFGHPNAIRMVGAEEVTEKELRSALLRSGGFVFSSHPVSDFEVFLKKLKRSLEEGYKKSGFPKIVVKADWDEEQSEVLVNINEGPRYRMGELMIEGSKVLTADVLKEQLIKREDSPVDLVSRDKETFRALGEMKRLPKGVVEKVAKEKFPWLVPAEDPAGKNPEKGKNVQQKPNLQIDALFEDDSDDEEEKPWEPGKWVDYRYAEGKIVRQLQKVYETEGRRYPKFETKWILREDEPIADLKVKVIDEGLAMKLGTIHLVGNRANTREEVLDYLGLSPGMSIKLDFVNDLRRKLFDSGRFLGWEVLTTQADPVNKAPEQLELLLVVAEHWQAPSLSEALSREQVAYRKLAQWLNGKAMVESDLVFSVELERKVLVSRIECAIGQGGLALAIDMRDRTKVRGVLAEEGELELLVQSLAKSYRVATPISENRIALNVFLQDGVENRYSLEIPQGSLETHGFSFSLKTSTKKGGEILFGFDPATAVSIAAALGPHDLSFDDGQVTIISNDWTLRFEEATGRLLDGRSESESPEAGKITLSLKPEQGAFDRIRKEANPPRGKDMVNLELDNSASLGIATVASLAKLIKSRNPGDEALATDKLLSLLMSGIKKWEEPATAMVSFLSSLTGGEDDDEEFIIPMEVEDFGLLQGGGYLALFLGLGGYDLLDQFVEPGSWPDRVLREAVFFLGGRPQHLNETVKDLLEDESMGPFGSLLCSTLLQKMNHPEARAFLLKAQGELNEDGFAKDWKQIMWGKADDEGPGWLLLEALKTLGDDQLDDILPKKGSDGRKEVDEFISEIREINPAMKADALKPIMGRIWRQVEPQFSPWVHSKIENLTPRVDPSEVAITVKDRNGFLKVRRGVIPFVEAFTQISGVQRVALSWEEESLDYLLFARQIWNMGMAAPEAMVKQRAAHFRAGLRPEVWKKMTGMGLTEEQFEEWVGVILAGMQYKMELLKRAQITEEEVKEFFLERKGLFKPAVKLDILQIRKEVNGNGRKEHATMLKIIEEVKLQKTLAAKVATFKKLGGPDFRSFNDVDLAQFNPQISALIKGMVHNKQRLSKVIPQQVNGQRSFALLLLPGDPKMGEARTFEEVKDKAKALAIIDREGKRLRQRSLIDRFEMPAPGAPKPPVVEKAAPSDSQPGLLERMMEEWAGSVVAAGAVFRSGKEEKKTFGGTREEYSRHRQEVSRGNGEALYYMGTYAERRMGDETGIDVAVRYYEKAASKGEVRAMIRLAELYRIGRGVSEDKAKSLEWREKAAQAELEKSK